MFVYDKEFTRAHFPPGSVLQPQFTLLPSLRVFSLLNNDQGCEFGSVFVLSNKRFQLVLEHVDYDKTVQWVEWEGGVVANTVSNYASLAVNNGVVKEVVSQISFDGLEWTQLQVLDCSGCRLHIRTDTVRASGSGLVVAQGNVGEKLEHSLSVFVSRDAGKTWRQLGVNALHIAVASEVIVFVSETTREIQFVCFDSGTLLILARVLASGHLAQLILECLALNQPRIAL